MSETQYAPLILLPGMGADERMFGEQRAALANLRVPDWIDPLPSESLQSYAERLAREIDPGVPCFIGGASFGGFVALEMVPHLDVLACFLIGSVRSPEEFPKRIKILKMVSGAVGVFPFELVNLLTKLALLCAVRPVRSHAAQLITQLSDSDPSFLRWACQAALTWEGCANCIDAPTCEIHGEKDAVLPCCNTKPAIVVKGAGHILSMSHAEAVTRFLKRYMRVVLA